MGEKFSRCKSAGYPPAKFYGHDTLYIVVANCSYPRTASGHHGGEQCGPQLLLWYSVPASCTPYIAGGSEGTLCLPSASGCHSHASQPAVLPPGGEACVFSQNFVPGSTSAGQPGCPQGTLGRRGIFYSSHGKSPLPKCP